MFLLTIVVSLSLIVQEKAGYCAIHDGLFAGKMCTVHYGLCHG
jgi:N-formylglutamate amidohydrolase